MFLSALLVWRNWDSARLDRAGTKSLRQMRGKLAQTRLHFLVMLRISLRRWQPFPAKPLFGFRVP